MGRSAGRPPRRVGSAPFGRLVLIVTGPVLLVSGISACADEPSDASPTTVAPLQPTNYVTQPIVPASTTTVVGSPMVPGGTVGTELQYRVRSGDAVSLIADRYGITPGALASYNGWDEGIRHLLRPGDVVKIPSFADVPEPVSNDPDDEEGPADTIPFEPICPDGSDQEIYEVQPGDYVGRVARQFDVAVEELDEVNARTAGYAAFYPGLEILVPCPVDREPATGTTD